MLRSFPVDASRGRLAFLASAALTGSTITQDEPAPTKQDEPPSLQLSASAESIFACPTVERSGSRRNARQSVTPGAAGDRDVTAVIRSLSKDIVSDHVLQIIVYRCRMAAVKSGHSAVGSFNQPLPDFSGLRPLVSEPNLLVAWARLQKRLWSVTLRSEVDTSPAALSRCLAEIAYTASKATNHWLSECEHEIDAISGLLIDSAVEFAVERSAMLVLLNSCDVPFGSTGMSLGQAQVLAARLFLVVCCTLAWLATAIIRAVIEIENSTLIDLALADVLACVELMEQIQPVFEWMEAAVKVVEDMVWTDLKMPKKAEKLRKCKQRARPNDALTAEAAAEISRLMVPLTCKTTTDLEVVRQNVREIAASEHYHCRGGVRSIYDRRDERSVAERLASWFSAQPPRLRKMSNDTQQQVVEELLAVRLKSLTTSLTNALRERKFGMEMTSETTLQRRTSF